MRRTVLAFLVLMMLGFIAIPLTAQAQSVSLGVDERQVFQSLQARGYRGMKVVRRRLASIRVQACKGNQKYEVKVVLGGIVTNEKQIGGCDLNPEGRNYASERQIENRLQERGYDDIDIQRNQRGYRVTACRDGEQEILFYSFEQTLEARQRAGRCARPTVSPEQAVALLRKEGFTAIKLIDATRPPYRIEACKADNKFQFVIGRRGRIRDQRRIGSCRRPIQPQQLAERLEKRGYDRVRILRSDRRPYLAEACHDLNLVELRIDRFGDILKEDRIGKCAAPLSKDDVTTLLHTKGYSIVGLIPRRRGWQAEVCRDENKFAIRINRRGEIQREGNTGKCSSRSVLEVLKTLESRGAKRLSTVVEGCFNKDRFRWSFDRLGKRTGRKRIGSC